MTYDKKNDTYGIKKRTFARFESSATVAQILKNRSGKNKDSVQAVCKLTHSILELPNISTSKKQELLNKCQKIPWIQDVKKNEPGVKSYFSAAEEHINTLKKQEIAAGEAGSKTDLTFIYTDNLILDDDDLLACENFKLQFPDDRPNEALITYRPFYENKAIYADRGSSPTDTIEGTPVRKLYIAKTPEAIKEFAKDWKYEKLFYELLQLNITPNERLSFNDFLYLDDNQQRFYDKNGFLVGWDAKNKILPITYKDEGDDRVLVNVKELSEILKIGPFVEYINEWKTAHPQ